MSLGLIHILFVALVVSLVLLCVSVYFNIKFGLTILRFEDSVEECLDIIDERYGSISKVLEIPIFFDSVEVRQVVNDISATRGALLVIANKLAGDSSDDLAKEVKGEP